MPPTLSLLVPTRGRPALLRRFLDSVAATARHPERIEVVLVVDQDDPASLLIEEPRLTIRRVIGPAGRTMGELNTAGYAASVGEFVMLLNDDVIVRTRNWDDTVLACFRRFPDPFVLVHVNDTLIREHLCVFPLVSRVFCELAGGICPAAYHRYRIDDHTEDVFNLLAALGERRAVYLPDVVFEHTNAVEDSQAGRIYLSDPAILAQDAPLFEELFPVRKELALRVLGQIRDVTPADRNVLDTITDPFALRTPGRQHVVRAPWWRRVRNRYERDGCRGLVRAVRRRFTSGRE